MTMTIGAEKSETNPISNDSQGVHAPPTDADLLRFITCGSVDDGKSTLIGRLLYDSKRIFEDQLAAVTKDSKKFGTTGEVDLALLVDGLQSEREQGITIDVAYRYFSTDKRSFIIADTPGHEQYTRNMVTGASGADLAIILVDARKGVQVQTKRHSYIVSLLGIKRIVVAINKMDLVDFDQTVFNSIKQEYETFAAGLSDAELSFVPVSALEGDNVVAKSRATPWYTGESLLSTLESASTKTDQALNALRFPVQYVNRPHLDFRGYCGTVAAGTLRVGEEVMALPSKRTSRIKSILTYDAELNEAEARDAVTVTLEDEIDLGRGDVLVYSEADSQAPSVSRTFDARVVWMAEEPLQTGKQYRLKLGSKLVRGSVEQIHYATDVNTFEEKSVTSLHLNEIGLCRLSLLEDVVFDPYDLSPATGSFIFIDPLHNGTVGAGMITESVQDVQAQLYPQATQVTTTQRAEQKNQTPTILWFTGLSGAGKSTLANALELRLFELGQHTYLLDGDNVRTGLNKDLSFSAADRSENIRRIGETAKLFVDAGLIVLSAFISPFRADRDGVRSRLGENEFIEIFVDAPLELCEERDPKGIYKRARAGEIKSFTGIDSPYEAPLQPELVVDTRSSLESCVDKIVMYLQDREIIRF